jgi:hypothetical protein
MEGSRLDPEEGSMCRRPVPYSLLLALGVVPLIAARADAGSSIGTAFTYQGRLADAGSPASAPFDFEFRLFNAPSGGGQIGPTVSVPGLVVAAGLFTTTLDFGTGAFVTDARFLEIAVRPAGGGSFTTLSPRQHLTPAPFAMSADSTHWPGITSKPAGFADNIDDDALGGLSCADGEMAKRVGGTWVCAPDNGHDHFSQTWSGSAAGFMGFRVVNTGTGGFSDGVWGQSDAFGNGRGVVGYATAPSGTNYGVWGQSDSTEGRGVWGLAPASSGVTYGVYGEASSPNGYAGYFPGRVAVNVLDRSAPGELAIGPSTATSVTITPSTSVLGTLTVGGGTPIAKVLSTTVVPNVSVAIGATTIYTVPSLAGAAPGDTLIVTYSGSPPFPCSFNGWVSSPNTVTLKFDNTHGSESCVVGGVTYRLTVIHF